MSNMITRSAGKIAFACVTAGVLSTAAIAPAFAVPVDAPGIEAAGGPAAAPAQAFPDFEFLGAGSHEATGEGLNVNSVGKGDTFAIAKDQSYGDAVYSVDVTFNDDSTGAASLLLHANDATEPGKVFGYIANVNRSTGECRLFKFEESKDGARADFNMLPPIQLGANVARTFHLSLTSIGKHMVYTVSYEDADGQTVSKTASTADYTVGANNAEQSSAAHYGQNSALLTGFNGLLTFEANVTYDNYRCEAIDEQNTSELFGLQIVNAGQASDVTMPLSFHEGQYVYIGYVQHSAQLVKIEWDAPAGSTVAVTDMDDNPCEVDGNSAVVPIKNRATTDINLGLNQYTLTVTQPNGAVAVYRVRVFAEAPSNTYYNEDWRGQYHFSVKNGWGNDPSGLVKTSDGVYHFGHQYFSESDWGPMHWGYSTSTDLIHWEQQPIELYPDEYGAMFSGCGVYATHETAPTLFAEGQEGMVYIVTGNGCNGQDGKQRLTLAYRVYDPATRTFGPSQKYSDVLLDYTTDDVLPVPDGAFRDPKVFRFDNKWFLIVAGGPVRLYSSTDLVNWKGEDYLTEPGTSNLVYTECPDLYPVATSEGEVKWILSRGGRSYKVGEFKKVGTTKVAGGEYTFVQDEGTPDYTMNFGRDSYAAMTFFEQGKDFGTSGNVQTPELISANWMNTWDDYCRQVNKNGNKIFNGTYNLFLEQSLVKLDDGSFRLVQTPVGSYETLRDEAAKVEVSDTGFEGISTAEELQGFSGTSYEIEATFTPAEGAEPTVGFNVRERGSEKTRVSYNFETGEIAIDRKNSGAIISDKFAGIMSQQNVEKNADGSITLHLYVDRASIEVFTAGNTVAGGAQIFPSGLSDGLSAFSEGGASSLEAVIYPMKSVWDAEEPSTDPQRVVTSQSEAHVYVGGSIQMGAYVSPAAADQGITVSSSNDAVLRAEMKDGSIALTGVAAGEATVTVASTKNPAVAAQVPVTVTVNNFNTNVSGMDVPTSSFWADGEYMVVSSKGKNSFLVSDVEYPVDGMVYSVDVSDRGGLPNLIWGMQTEDPYAGCYALQLQDGGVRLFDFKGDRTFATAPYPGGYAGGDCTVSITTKDGVITAAINGETCLTYQLDNADPTYESGRVALGQWDSDTTRFANFELSGSALTAIARAELASVIDEANGLAEKDYTAESWAVLQAELKAAKAVMDDPNATVDELEAAAAAVRGAIDKLEAADPEGGEQPGPGGDAGEGGDQGGDPQDPPVGDKAPSGTIPQMGDAAAAVVLPLTAGMMLTGAGAALRKKRQ